MIVENVFSRMFSIYYYCKFIVQMRRSRFKHSPFSKSGLVYLLSTITYVYSPLKIVQLGVGEGLSCIAMLLSARLRKAKKIHLIGYDNFSYRSVGETVSKGKFEQNIRKYKLSAFVELRETNLLETECPLVGVDLLNIDIDNTYDKLYALYQLKWFDCVTAEGIVVIEGGLSKHDNRDETRGITQFCQFLQGHGFQTFTVKRYPGIVLVKKLLKEEFNY